jgi:hypothetical protein
VIDTITNVMPFPRRRRRGSALSNRAALDWIREWGAVEADSYASLGDLWGWERSRASKAVKAWVRAGEIEIEEVGNGGKRSGKIRLRVQGTERGMERETEREIPAVTMREIPAGNATQRVAVAGDVAGKSSRVRLAAQAAGQQMAQVIDFPLPRHLVEPFVEPSDMLAMAPDEPPPPPARDQDRRSLTVANGMAYAAAVGLAAVAAWFSLKGLAVLFPGAPIAIVVMGGVMEAAKLIACGWLAGAWRGVPWVFRVILMLLIAGLAAINAAGTFSQLTSAHVGDRAMTAATRTMQATELDSRLEVASAKLADLDHRIAVIDGIISGAAQRGRANTAQAVMADQSKARAALVGERQRAAEALAALKVDRGGVEARTTIADSETMPLRFAAEVLGIGGDSERAIRWLIALMVLCCDPLAIALTAAASVRRGRK